MFPRMLSQVASRWVTVAALLASLSGVALAGGQPGPRLNAAQYRDRKAVYQQRALNQAGRYDKTGSFKQHVWSEANKIRAHAEELKARAAASTNPAEKKQLWEKAQGLNSKADALAAQVRRSSPSIKPTEPGTKALPAPEIAGALPAPATPAALPAPKQPIGLLPAGSDAPRIAVGPNVRKASATAYDRARLRFESARAQSQLAKVRGDEAAALAYKLNAARDKVAMLRSQAQGLRAKANQAKAAGNIDLASKYIDKADRLNHSAKKITNILNRMEKGTAPVTTPPAVTPGPEPTNANSNANATSQKPVTAAAEQKQPKPPQVTDKTETENPFDTRNAYAYRQRLPDHTARSGDKLRDVKKLLDQRDFEGSLEVLSRLEAKSGLVNRIQAARARRAIRKEAGRVMRNGAEGYTENVEAPWMKARLENYSNIDRAHELVASGAMSVADAKEALSQLRQRSFGSLPRRSQTAVYQAERVLVRLARVEQEHKTGPVRGLISKLGSLVFGSATSTLKGGVAKMQERAEQLAKEGPEGALAAHLMINHAKTLARNARDLGLNPKKIEKKSQAIHRTAVRNLFRTIEAARKGDPEAMSLAYNALEALRLDNPQPGLADRIAKDMGNYEHDMRQASLGALDQLSRYAEKLSKIKSPEAMAEAARVNTAALGVRDVMLTNGIAVPKKVAERIEKIDDKVNGRTKFGYKFRHAEGLLAKTGVVLAQAAKIIGKTAFFPVKVVTLPIRLPARLVKRMVVGNGMLEPGEVERKMRGLGGYAASFMPEELQRQMQNSSAEETEEVAAAVPTNGGQRTYVVPPPAILNNMPGR